jgi:hypothetical protein
VLQLNRAGWCEVEVWKIYRCENGRWRWRVERDDQVVCDSSATFPSLRDCNVDAVASGLNPFRDRVLFQPFPQAAPQGEKPPGAAARLSE